MQMPNNYKETQAQGEYVPVQLGGHYLVIKNVEEQKSSTGKDMIVVRFDFDQNDVQPGYFMESFKNDIRPDKKWSNQATKYILVYDNDGKTSRSFKTFCSCVEHSNNGFTVQWVENWGEQFKNKKVGAVFGEEWDFYDGKEIKKKILRWFVSTDKVSEATVPDISESKNYKEHKAAAAKGDDGFMNVPDEIDSELPW